jgi:hypothetical protein
LDVHKPKPWRGWREFLKEYGIIVLGVLTALAGEQIVEAVHHHDQVRDLRRALDQELAWDLGAMKDYVDETACANQRLDELERWRRSFQSGRPLKLNGPIVSPPTFAFRTSVWRSAAGAAVDLMPLDQRIAYARFYDGVENNERLRSRAGDLWDDLAEFEDATTLTPEQQRHVAHDLKSLAGLTGVMVHNYQNWTTTYAPPLHIAIDQATIRSSSHAAVAEGRAGFCQPLLAK